MNAAPATSNQAPSIPHSVAPDSKVLLDLSTVTEKIAATTSMLQPLTSTDQIESHPESDFLLANIGFLEACVPRVRELIEAGMTGALQEDTVVKCLAVNDELCQALEFVDHPEKCQASAASTAIDNEFDAFGIDDKTASSKQPAMPGSTIDDLLSPDTDTKNHAQVDPDVAKARNEFDDFFNDS